MAEQKHHVPKLQQAEIDPIQTDGVAAFSAGLALAIVVAVVVYFNTEQLPAWLPQTAASAVVVGVLGLGYAFWRKTARKKNAAR